jgi:polysaccharide chain length determinant protein (PEP-CTERM system associated)
LAEITSSQLNLFRNLGFRDYLDIAKRRKWWIILSCVGLSISTSIVAWRLPPIYSAQTVILVDNSGVPDKYVPSISTGDIASRLTTLEQQVLSPTRLKRLVEAQGLYPKPDRSETEEGVVRRVQKSIVVELVNPGGGRMSAFRIAYRSKNRLEVAPVANQLAQMFIEENLKARVDQTEETAQFLEDQVLDTKRQLDAKETELRDLESRNVMDLPESKPYHMEALAGLRSQVVSIQEKIREYERERDTLQSILLSGAIAPTVDVGSEGGVGVSSYQAQIQKLEAHLADLKVRYGAAHPEVRRTESEIAKLKTQAAAEAASNPVAKPQQEITAPLKKPRNPVLEAEIEKLNQQIKEQNQLLPPLQNQMAFHESKLELLPAFEQRLARVRQDYDSLRTLYLSLKDKEQAARLSHALEIREKGEKFEVLDAAVPPTGPVGPSRVLLSIAGLVGGLLAGVALAGVAEMNDDSVRSEHEAVHLAGKHVLGGIPFIESAEEKRKRIVHSAKMLGFTAAGAAVFGFLLSVVSGGFF